MKRYKTYVNSISLFLFFNFLIVQYFRYFYCKIQNDFRNNFQKEILFIDFILYQLICRIIKTIVYITIANFFSEISYSLFLVHFIIKYSFYFFRRFSKNTIVTPKPWKEKGKFRKITEWQEDFQANKITILLLFLENLRKIVIDSFCYFLWVSVDRKIRGFFPWDRKSVV